MTTFSSVSAAAPDGIILCFTKYFTHKSECSLHLLEGIKQMTAAQDRDFRTAASCI